MSSCSAEFKKTGKASSERQAYMSECLKKEDPKMAQQEKMKTCNAQAKRRELTGDKRREFMSDCLSG